LTEYESKKILADYAIPTLETHLAATVDEAVKIAGEIGYPVVLKLNSETITHKTDVGGVRLNLAGAGEVQAAFEAIETAVTEKAGKEHFQGVTVQPMLDLSEAYELIIGSSPDAQFGPVLLFGTGGTMVEVYKDRALALPPLNTTLARRMMERTKVFEALKGIRGRQAVDLDGLEKLLVRFSFLVVEQRWIKEIDINPLLASADGRLIRDKVQAEQHLLGQYNTEVASVSGDARNLVGRIAFESFRRVRQQFYHLVLKGDVGRVDVAFTRKQDKTTEIQKLSAQKDKELRALDRDFKEVLEDIK
jgi:succinyl-CoA synthetase beta subunit